jgi:hypothetical protein
MWGSTLQGKKKFALLQRATRSKVCYEMKTWQSAYCLKKQYHGREA